MSLFRSVTRYRVSYGQNPQENRLTEVTGAVLERVDGLAVAFVRRLLDEAIGDPEENALSATSRDIGGHGHEQLLYLVAARSDLGAMTEPQIRLRTQRTTSSRKFVDLEVRIGPGAEAMGKILLFWIEVKHGAGVHGTQLEDYLTDIEDVPADERLVLLLAPRQSMPELTAIPEVIPVVEWQAITDEVSKQLRRRDLNQVERFLLTDYRAYLDEEGLMDADMLTAEHAFVLSAYPDAEQAVTKLIELADALVRKLWGPPELNAGGRNPKYGPGYWTNYPPDAGGEAVASWRGTKFEWGMFIDKYRDQPRGGWVFVAGATFDKDNPAQLQEDETWRMARVAEDFEYVEYGGLWRLWRHRYPEELLAICDLPKQAQALADWILKAFESLTDSQPPH